eukprot:3320927-Prymnesium_polylepis.1
MASGSIPSGNPRWLIIRSTDGSPARHSCVQSRRQIVTSSWVRWSTYLMRRWPGRLKIASFIPGSWYAKERSGGFATTTQ